MKISVIEVLKQIDNENRNVSLSMEEVYKLGPAINEYIWCPNIQGKSYEKLSDALKALGATLE